MINRSIPSVLREHAGLQPNGTAFTYVDYEQDWDGVTESLTWSQLYRRSLNLAQELTLRGSAGDRAVILAPQGINYIDAFLGALQAGLIPVPLAVPLGGATDERVISVLRDASPSVVLTTSAVADNVAEYAELQADRPGPAIVEVDSLDLDVRATYRAGGDTGSDTTYLQYTSGSTRSPAGVMVSYRNIWPISSRSMPASSGIRQACPAGYHRGVLAAVLSRHGTASRNHLAGPDGIPHGVHQPGRRFCSGRARWMQLLASEQSRTSRQDPTFAFELAARKTSDDDMAGLDLGNVLSILNGASGCSLRHSALHRAVRPFQPSREGVTSLIWNGRSNGVCREPKPGRPPRDRSFRIRKTDRGPRGAVCRRQAVRRWSVTACRSRRSVRIVDPETSIECPPGASVKSGCTAATSRPAIGTNPRRLSRRSVERLSPRRPALPKVRGCGPEIWASSSTMSCSSSAVSRTC